MFGFRMNIKVSKCLIYQAFRKIYSIIYADESGNPAITMGRVFFMDKRNIMQSIVKLTAAKLMVSF